jgi:pimeloyl-ACP methyl ester carboxylesterase
VCGDGYRAVLDQVLPDAGDEAVREADLFFQVEMPAVQQWSFGPSDAARVAQPVLNVLGAESASRFAEGSELVQSWFPQAERLSVPDAGHLLMVQNPAPLAQGLTDFFARHPIGDAGRPDLVTG